ARRPGAALAHARHRRGRPRRHRGAGGRGPDRGGGRGHEDGAPPDRAHRRHRGALRAGRRAGAAAPAPRPRGPRCPPRHPPADRAPPDRPGAHPMNLELDEENQDLSDTVRDFADEVIAPASARYDAAHEFPYDIVAQMREIGLFGLPFPEESGVTGGHHLARRLALEPIGHGDQSVAITLEAGVSLGAMPIFRFGTEEQKQRWLPDLAAGKALAGFGLTEPEAGSDAGGTRTTAKREDGQWVLNG